MGSENWLRIERRFWKREETGLEGLRLGL